MTTIAAQSSGTAERHRAGRLSLLMPVLAYTVLMFAGVAAWGAVPHPVISGPALAGHNEQYRFLLRLGTWFLFVTGPAIAVAATAFYRRLRLLKVDPMASGLALSGGTLAAAALTASGLVNWVDAGLGADAGPSLHQALVDLAMLFGGPAFVASYATLIAGVALGARRARLLPAGVVWLGLLITVAGAIASLMLISSSLVYFLPVVRFGGTLWLIAAAALMPRSSTTTQSAVARPVA